MKTPESIEETDKLLRRENYIPALSLVVAVFLCLKLKQPLFLEGRAGVGKTELAKVIAHSLSRKLIRLQCYEGLDISSAVYEWNYPRQMMAIRLAESQGSESVNNISNDIYGSEYLIERPLLAALRQDESGPPVLLIDELDRTDAPFEAFLLEVLSDYQVSIPEIGSIVAEEPPIVIITSNRTREVHDALKRRCLYHWVDYPSPEIESEILRLKVPDSLHSLNLQVIEAVKYLRSMELIKPPGVSETLDWIRALLTLNKKELDADSFESTKGVILKYQDDIERINQEADYKEFASAAGFKK